MYRRGQIVVDTVPEPRPAAGQILVKTLICGICGSDLHFQHHAHAFVDVAERSGASAMTVDLQRDVILGHEFCAEVVEFGPETERRVKRGQAVCSVPVAVGPSGPRTIGYSNDFPGGFAEYMLLNEALVLPVPEGLAPVHAALTEPMAVGWHAVQIARMTSDHAPLVIGCGPVGLAVIAALKRCDARPIIAADYSEGRRELALQMGADEVIDPAVESPYAAWTRRARPGLGGDGLRGAAERVCVAFECVGVPGVLGQIMEGVPEGSEIIVVGACMEPDTVEPMMAMYKALTLRFSRTYTAAEFAAVLQMIGDGSLDVAPLVSEPLALREVPQAFLDLARPAGRAKVFVDPTR